MRVMGCFCSSERSYKGRATNDARLEVGDNVKKRTSLLDLYRLGSSNGRCKSAEEGDSKESKSSEEHNPKVRVVKFFEIWV